MKMLLNYKYLSSKHLKGFDNYKYNAIDSSPLSKYVMHPFWNKIVDYTPIWIAPNLLTLVGFLFVLSDFLLLTIYDYRYYASSTTKFNYNEGSFEFEGEDSPVPDIVFILVGLFLFIGYTLDGIDGKQARKLKVSGPLGELFDHGLDSYVVFFIPVCLYSIFGRLDYSLPPIRMYFITSSIVFNFYASHVEKYNTGCLFLPWSYDLSVWTSSMLFIMAGVLGTNYFKMDLPGGYTLANVFELGIHCTGLLTTLPVSYYNVLKSYKNGTGKMRTLSEALRPIWALLIIFIVVTFWAYTSPNDILNYDPRMFYLLFGTLFSSVSCRLIVSQMSNQRCDAISWLLIPLCATVAVSFMAPEHEIALFYFLNLFCLVAHVHYGICVVRQLCKHLRVDCFKVKKQRKFM